MVKDLILHKAMHKIYVKKKKKKKNRHGPLTLTSGFA